MREGDPSRARSWAPGLDPYRPTRRLCLRRLSRDSTKSTGEAHFTVVAKRLALAGTAVALVAAAGVFVLLRGTDRVPDRNALSLVVLPLTNLTGDPALENDADEMTEPRGSSCGERSFRAGVDGM